MIDKRHRQEFEDRLEFAALSDEEKELIRDKAAKEVVEERKRQASEAYLNAALAVERRRGKPMDEYQDVLIDLPGHAVRVLVDGVEYLHSFTYRLTGAQAASIREMMQRSWNHEREVGGASRQFYREPRQLRLGAHNINVPNARLLGV
jgi:hypothetical protein